MIKDLMIETKSARKMLEFFQKIHCFIISVLLKSPTKMSKNKSTFFKVAKSPKNAPFQGLLRDNKFTSTTMDTMF